jgi:hypothetical protein
VLGDPAGFACGDRSMPEGIEEGRLAVIDVALSYQRYDQETSRDWNRCGGSMRTMIVTLKRGQQCFTV